MVLTRTSPANSNVRPAAPKREEGWPLLRRFSSALPR